MQTETSSSYVVGLGRAAVGVGIYLLVSTIVDVVAESLGFDTARQGALLVTLAIGWLVTYLIVVGRAPLDFASRFAVRSFAPDILLPLVILCLGWSVIRVALILLMPEELLFVVEPPHYSGNGIVVALAVLVVGPIAEELFFRGWMFRGLRARYGFLWSAVLSSILFGLLHLNPGSILNSFLGGMLYAWLTYQTGSVWPAVVAHSLGNASGTVLEWVGVSAGLVDRDDLPFDHVPLPLLAVSLAAVIIGLWVIQRRYRRRPSVTRATCPGK